MAPEIEPVAPQPNWERRYPGRLGSELQALKSAGITPTVDYGGPDGAQLSLTFDWPLDPGTFLRLRAVYPDSFPHIRPQVFLLSGLDPIPQRHVSPGEGNVCLLGRDSRQWLPSWTLHRLLSEQLKDALRGTGEEDRQGEPAEYWWNAWGRAGSFCLVDSAWGLGDSREGTLVVRYVVVEGQAVREHNSNGELVFQAFIAEVRDRAGALVHEWDGPLPSSLLKARQELRIPWVRVDETVLPSHPVERQLGQLRQGHEWLQRLRPQRYVSGSRVDPFAIVHSSELSFNETGLGWIIALVTGHPKAFTPSANRENRRKRLSVVPVYRAGRRDVGYRVPSVKLLRDKRVLLIGTGSIGAPIAIELARSGCGALHLIEHDLVEPGNTVRWPIGTSAWGHRKLDALSGFLGSEYPATDLWIHPHQIGQVGPVPDARGDDEVIEQLLNQVDIVIDASASHGVTTFLSDCCRAAGLPLISASATPTVEGGVVVLHGTSGGCPNCLEHAWYEGSILPPRGRGSEDALNQPPGCAERTFIGAGYDLQELSLQAVRLAIAVLSQARVDESLVQTLSLSEGDGRGLPPCWREDPLPKHSQCRCRE